MSREAGCRKQRPAVLHNQIARILPKYWPDLWTIYFFRGPKMLPMESGQSKRACISWEGNSASSDALGFSLINMQETHQATNPAMGMEEFLSITNMSRISRNNLAEVSANYLPTENRSKEKRYACRYA